MGAFRSVSIRLCVLLTAVSVPTFGVSQTAALKKGLYENSNGSPIYDLIDSAQRSLDIEIYEMDDPKVIAGIKRAIHRGVIVHIVKEPTPVGGACKVFDAKSRIEVGTSNCADQIDLVDEVNANGGEYVPFTKPELCGEDGRQNCLEHGKIMVADSKVAMVTSGNFNTTNLCDDAFSPKTCNRDYSFITDDSDVVSTLEAVVKKDIIGKNYDVASVMSDGAENKMTVGPNSSAPLIAFIKSAKKSLQVQNQYLKDPAMNAAIIAVAKKGVKVAVNVSSECSFGKPKASQIKKMTAIYKSFEAAGIEISMFNKNIKVNEHNGYLHAKAFVVDGKSAWMGSVNGSTQAATINREFGVFFNDPANVTALSKALARDFDDVNAETWEESMDCAENG